MCPAPAIGIDLGTVNSCVAVYKNGKPEIIANQEGNRLTPSWIYYDPIDNKDVFVGKSALNKHVNFYKNGICDAKRLIGRKFDDPYIQSKLKYFSFNIVPGEDGDAEIEISQFSTESSNKITTSKKKPEEISAEVLKKLKEDASQFLNEDITDAVITVPAYFNNAQRKATKRAGELAGLKVLKLMNEPTAAALFYTQDKMQEDKIILVFDLGGGTLDVSIIQINNNKEIEVKAVNGDNFLGGRDFDDQLIQLFQGKYKVDKSSGRREYVQRRRTKRVTENLKKLLSFQEEAVADLDYYVNGEDVTINITRKEFEEVNLCNFQQAINVVDSCIKNANLDKTDIDEVILVGGSTRIPKIQNMLSAYFNGKHLKKDLNPDEAVAAGAAVQAFLIQNNDSVKEENIFKIIDVTPLSLGDELWGGLMKVIIERNTPVPTSRTVYSVTTKNNQETCEFCIYEGERKQVKFNRLLGEFKICGLRPAPAGDVEFEKTLRINEDGILEIIVTEDSTGRTGNLILEMNKYRLCEREVANSIEDAMKYKYEDDQFEELIGYLSKIRKCCNTLLCKADKESCHEIDSTVIKERCTKILLKINDITVRGTNIDEMIIGVKNLQQDFICLKELILPSINQSDLDDIRLQINS